MSIFNQRFEIKINKRKHHIDTITEFFKKNLKKNKIPLRYAVVGVKRGKLIVEASILEE
jgi:hypothetical protein